MTAEVDSSFVFSLEKQSSPRAHAVRAVVRTGPTDARAPFFPPSISMKILVFSWYNRALERAERHALLHANGKCNAHITDTNPNCEVKSSCI